MLLESDMQSNAMGQRIKMDTNVLSQLVVLRRQYFQLVEPSQLRWPEDGTVKRAEVQSWIFGEMFDSENISILPPDRYRLRVLKLLVSKLERAIDDPEEDVGLSACFLIRSRCMGQDTAR